MFTRKLSSMHCLAQYLILTTVASLPQLTADSFNAPGNYYKSEPQFHMAPDPTAARYKIKRFGPIGVGLELRRPNFTMHIVNIEEGSPAAATGELKKGQIIESVNGHVMKDEDPRVLLGNWITEAEANGGIVKLMVKDNAEAKAREVEVKIPALGSYSKTWPVDCKKTDRIIRECADFIAANKDSCGMGLNGSVLFLLSTGEEKDLEVVRGWMKKFVANYKKPAEGREVYPWFAGYTGPGFCEYYLRTGDESVLPIIKDAADSLSRTIYNGSWMGRGGASYGYMGGGHLNAAGLHAVTFLLMARECGVDVDEHTLQSSLFHIYRFAGHGNVAYGDHLPEGGFTANGKTEGLAFTMQAAANLHPAGEKSVYAKARDISANKAFYNTSWLFHGHTGGGIGELWKGRAMGLVAEKRPGPYRSFMEERRWMYELARTHQGLHGWISDWNVGYDDTAIEKRGWGAFIPMIYTVHRKALRLHGAPPTKYSHTYKIPDRPWGNKADEIFLSLTPGEYLPGKRQDVSKERLPTDASKPVLNRVRDPNISDELLLMYAHHFEHGIRSVAAGYINNHKRYHLVPQLLSSKDPRARRTGLDCINASNRKSKGFPAEQLTPEIFALIGAMIDNPEESWFVTMGALKAMGKARPEVIAPHFNRMMSWLDHHDWWLRSAAMEGLTPLASEERFYQPLLTKITEVVGSSQRIGDFSPLDKITSQLKQASPNVQQRGMEILGKSYLKYPTELVEPGGQDLTKNIELLLDGFAKDLAMVPGGYDVLYELSRKRNPKEALPHEKLFLSADASKFGPKLKKALEPTIKNRLIPEYIKANRKNLEKEINARMPGRATEGLVDLYQKLGVDDYNWSLYGPKKTEIDWAYHSFEGTDGKLWEDGTRYRKISWPEGLENWFMPAFDPKAAGWKVGHAPFGSRDGKLEWKGSCIGNFCGCGEPLATLWEKEILLMRSEITLPPLKDGYAYRLLVGGRSHVNHGDGNDVWIDGQYLRGRRDKDPSISYVGKRAGGKPWGRTLSDEFRPQFDDGKVTLSISGFMRYMKRTRIKGNRQSFWFEQMKLPELPPASGPKK
ncbi:MAG: hypothetical protein HKP20_06510 [Akkermansiaceae bacterium]|nr:hypothetical protein [Akkermansiaceae bacterium]